MKIYDKTTQTYKELVLKPGGDTLPIGATLPFSGDIIPNGWLLCDGSAFSASEYPELFDLIGVTYGWDEDRNPLLPDMRGRVVVGKKAATSVNDTEFNALGKTGGEKEHTLTKSELPQIDIQTNYASSSGGDGSGLVYGTKTGSSNNSLIKNVNYGGEAHNNLQPYIVTNFIIKAKMTIVTNGEVIQQNGTPSNTNVYSSNAVLEKIKTNLITGQVTETKETIDGAKVYVKVIDIGTLPNATRKIVSTGLDENINVVDLRGIAKGSNLTIPLPFVYPELPSCISLMFVEGNIYINTGSDRTDLTGTVKIYYTINNNGANTGGAN